MSRRVLKWISGTLAGLALLGIAAWAVLFHTETGARWGWARLAGDELTAQSVSGTIASGLDIQGISLVTEAFDLQASETRLVAERNTDRLPRENGHLDDFCRWRRTRKGHEGDYARLSPGLVTKRQEPLLHQCTGRNLQRLESADQ